MEKIESFQGKYRFLSNFHACVVKLDGKTYPSTEHAYQAAKTSDKNEREKIRVAATPGIAKRLGKEVDMRDDWDAVKLLVMEELLKQKFNQTSFKDLLLSTGDAELIEGNTWNDTFWGVCKGKGENHLGKLLMQIRAELRNELYL